MKKDNLPVAASQQLPVAVDAMGGDHGCSVIVEGAVAAARELGLSTVLVGQEDELRQELEAKGAHNDPHIHICHAAEVVTMDDSPVVAIRRKPDCSIRRAFELVAKNQASSVVSAGNTGAVMAAGLFVAGSMPGVGRPAIASLIPRVGTNEPVVLLDSGANVDCHAHQLVQFAVMGDFYARSAVSTDFPRVALLSNGTESSKGNDITRSAALMLSELPEMNFIGYIEGCDISSDVADVVVCDGFLGNIVLKTMEGTAELVFGSMLTHVQESARGKLGLWLTKPFLKDLFKSRLDPSSYGGAPLLGLNEIAIICHGSSNSRAIMNGIRVAQKFVDEALVGRVSQALSLFDGESHGVYEDGMWNRMGQRFDKKKESKKGAAKGVVEGSGQVPSNWSESDEKLSEQRGGKK